MTHWTEHTLVRDGVRLNYRDWGGGSAPRPPIVLLHGLAGHAGEWDTTARRLHARGHRVIALDQRGHGASDPRPADVSRAAYVSDVAALIDHLAAGPATLIGQS